MQKFMIAMHLHLCFLLYSSLSIEKEALTWLADTSDGDARIALGNLELVLQHVKNNSESCINNVINIDHIKEGIKVSVYTENSNILEYLFIPTFNGNYFDL